MCNSLDLSSFFEHAFSNEGIRISCLLSARKRSSLFIKFLSCFFRANEKEVFFDPSKVPDENKFIVMSRNKSGNTLDICYSIEEKLFSGM